MKSTIISQDGSNENTGLAVKLAPISKLLLHHRILNHSLFSLNKITFSVITFALN